MNDTSPGAAAPAAARERFTVILQRAQAAVARQFHLLVPSVILLAALALRIFGAEKVEVFQNIVFDAFQTLTPRVYRDTPVRIVDIDDETLGRLGQWPWPRTRLAQLVSRLAAQGASTIVLDFVFPEPDRASPAQIVKLLQGFPEIKALSAKAALLPDNDKIFSKAVSSAKVVAGYTMALQETPSAPAVKAGFSSSGDSPLLYLAEYPGAIINIPEIESAASGNGCFSIPAGRDGIIRRLPMLFRQGEEIFPSLSLEALRVFQGASGFMVKSAGARGVTSFGEHTGISQVRTGKLVIPTDAEGRMLIYYAAPEARRTIPAWKYFEANPPAEPVTGAIVLLGTSASRLMDLHPAPGRSAMPGVEIHAQAIEQALLGDFLRRPDWADGAEITYLLLLGAALIILLPRLGARWCGIIGLAATAVTVPLSWLAFAYLRWLLDPVFPAVVALTVYLSSSWLGYMKAENERRRLEVLDKVKDEFVSTVSHDLRGPVAGIIMIVDMMSRGAYGPLTDRQKQFLLLVKDSGRKLISFVTNVLDAAKIRAGKMEFRMQEVSPLEVMSGLADLFALSASSKGVSLTHKVPEGLPQVRADREKLEQVINNLIGNAIKFTTSGQAIVLEASSEGAFVCFTVRDTGYGISPEDIKKLFQKFAQVDLAAQKDRKVVGTGLGLSICKTIVEAHGGRIWVESEKGKGSAFRFTIPKSAAGTEPVPVPEAGGEKQEHP